MSDVCIEAIFCLSGRMPSSSGKELVNWPPAVLGSGAPPCSKVDLLDAAALVLELLIEMFMGDVVRKPLEKRRDGFSETSPSKALEVKLRDARRNGMASRGPGSECEGPP